MNKKLFFLAMGLFLSSSMIFGQTIQNSVISSTGASASSGNVKMDYTLGEIVVETFTSGGNTITQGFHQTNLTLVAIENPELFSEINVYPNPANEYINIDIPAGYDMLNITLFDDLGRLVSQQKEVSGLQTLDAHDLATGIYYLQVLSSSTNQSKTFKVIKTK
ncbi:MAG: T9SS type A sorting domain-containing protein [Bacteroidales bacterium]|nr:T9SS type A sorting domain-containing protein [Bacteroidales bacterium]